MAAKVEDASSAKANRMLEEIAPYVYFFLRLVVALGVVWFSGGLAT